MSGGGSHHRPRLFGRTRELPLVGKAVDWGLGKNAVSRQTKQAGARIAGLKATESVCPYCAVGCGQIVYTRDGELVDIEGNPRSPINQGTLCPKGAASRQLIQQPGRLTKVLYRRPGDCTSCRLADPFGQSVPWLIGEFGLPSMSTSLPPLV